MKLKIFEKRPLNKISDFFCNIFQLQNPGTAKRRQTLNGTIEAINPDKYEIIQLNLNGKNQSISFTSNKNTKYVR